MNKIRIDFFDILGYLIPGSALLIVLWVAADSKLLSVWHIYQSVHAIDQKSILIALFLAYIVGFVLHAFGSAVYNLYKYKALRKYRRSPVQDHWARIREYGEKHLAILERWYALRALSQNLAVVSLVGMLVSFAKYSQFGYYEWLPAGGLMIGLTFVLLKRAEIFHDYLNHDLEATLALGLEKGKTDGEG